MSVVWWMLAGAVMAAGLFLLVAGLRRGTGMNQPVPRHRIRLPAIGIRGLLAIVAGVLLTVVTGWLVWLVIVPLTAVMGPRLLAEPKNRDIEMMQALDRWLRTMAATMATGRSVLDAIRLSRRSAPELLHEPINRLVSRLNDRMTTDEALGAFADELNSPDVDAAVAALMLAARRGQTGAGRTLHELSDSLQHRLRAWREIETERAKPRIVVRQVTAVMAAVLVVSLVIGGNFFAPYGTATGQVILLGIVAAYVGSLLLLNRMTVPPPRERILAVRR